MKVLIIGGGQVGSYITNLLLEKDNEVTIIDNRESIIEKLHQEHTKAKIVLGDATDPNLLEDCHIHDMDALLCVTGKDEINLIVSTIAKMEYGVKRVIGRINHPKNAWLYTKAMGVDLAVNQADILGHSVFSDIFVK